MTITICEGDRKNYYKSNDSSRQATDRQSNHSTSKIYNARYYLGEHDYIKSNLSIKLYNYCFFY